MIIMQNLLSKTINYLLTLFTLWFGKSSNCVGIEPVFNRRINRGGIFGWRGFVHFSCIQSKEKCRSHIFAENYVYDKFQIYTNYIYIF